MKFEKVDITGKTRTLALAGVLAVSVATAVSAEDFEYHAIDEIPEGPGLITDESGEFTLFKWSRDKANDNSTQNTTSTQSAPAPAPAQTITSTSGITEAPTPE